MIRIRILILCIFVGIMSILFSCTYRRGPAFGGSVVKRCLSKRGFSFSSAWSTAEGAKFSSSIPGNVDSAINQLPNYFVAVAYQAKDREETNVFKRTGESPAKQSLTGEDNLFVSKPSPEGYIAMGVADGVGGWSEAGYDSSAISRELCSSLRSNFESEQNKDTVSPSQLLDNAFKEILESPKVEIGGTTACFGILGNNKLRVANLGDSWCGIFRNFELIGETKFQTHNFNTPYQLAKIPQEIINQAERQGRRYIIDSPSSADEYVWDVQKNDIIMFATDGVTDNVIADDIGLFLKDQIEGHGINDLNSISNKLMKETVKVSKDQNFPSAFAQELSRLTGQRYLGGKEDDITIILVKVSQ